MLSSSVVKTTDQPIAAASVSLVAGGRRGHADGKICRALNISLHTEGRAARRRTLALPYAGPRLAKLSPGTAAKAGEIAETMRRSATRQAT